MGRVQRILVATVLVLMSVVVGQQKYRIDSLANTVSYGQQKLDLSVLGSCGVIVDANGVHGGSCVAIAPDIILTAGHCISIPDTHIEINGIKYKILNKWRSQEYDVGFAKIEGTVPFVECADKIKLLDEVYAVGCPYYLDLNPCITKGVVSKLKLTWYVWKDIIQVDAEAAPGSSGCAVFNKAGKLVGIVVGGPQPGGGVTLCESVSHIKEALEEYNATITR